MEAVKQFDRIVLSSDVIVPIERLLNTPSQKDGMSHDLEVDLRVTGCDYIQSAGLLLKLPQVAMATAQILFHRFYYSRSFVKFKCYYSLMACLFLAAKIEESSRRLRDIINVFHHLRQKRKGSSSPGLMDYVGEEYFRMRNYINKYERYILKELGFCVHVQHPHKFLISCLQILELEKDTSLAQRAWNYMNDGLRTNIFVRFDVQTIACSCIFLAARQLKIALPLRPPWWELFDVKYSDMKTISFELLALYKRPLKPLHELEKQVELLQQILVSKKDDSKEGATPTPSQTASPAHLQVPPHDSQGKSPKDSSISPLAAQKTDKDGNEGEQSKNLAPPIAAATSDHKTSPVNGHKRQLSTTPPASPSPPPEKKPKLTNHSSTGEVGTSCKPIISPIKVSSGSGDEGEENGVLPSRYKLSPLHKTKRSRHHHSSSHHSNRHKRRRDKERRGRSRERSRERRSRSRDRRSWSRERSTSRERRREHKHYSSSYDDHYYRHHR